MSEPMKQDSAPIRLGMVGGGEGAMIGAIHRIAAQLDGQFRLIAGALSSDPGRASRSAALIGLDPARSYSDFAAMARQEATRADGIEAVAICTPNHLHYPVARAFLEQGIHVICDKPMTSTLADAQALTRLAADAPALFTLTQTYSGYPMVREARALVASGALGCLRIVQIEYAQDWLARPVEREGSKQAAWRTDPAQAGAGGAIGDIGTHAFHLAGFVTGESPSALLAELSSFVPGRHLDDNAGILLRYDSGARGMLWCSQVATGQANALRLRLFGEAASLEWQQETPETLIFTRLGEPAQLLRRGNPGAATAAGLSRLPGGHPEGYLEAFATLYREAAAAIRAHREGKASPETLPETLPRAEDGLAGLQFIDACIRSAEAGGVWVGL